MLDSKIIICVHPKFHKNIKYLETSVYIICKEVFTAIINYTIRRIKYALHIYFMRLFQHYILTLTFLITYISLDLCVFWHTCIHQNSFMSSCMTLLWIWYLCLKIPNDIGLASTLRFIMVELNLNFLLPVKCTNITTGYTKYW